MLRILLQNSYHEHDKLTGLNAIAVKRTQELPRSKIPESEWPKFHEATIKEWEAILETTAVTIISPKAAKDIYRTCPDRIIPSRHVYREKPGEGVGSCSTAKARWCVQGLHDPDLLKLERASPTPQTTSIMLFL